MNESDHDALVNDLEKSLADAEVELHELTREEKELKSAYQSSVTICNKHLSKALAKQESQGEHQVSEMNLALKDLESQAEMDVRKLLEKSEKRKISNIKKKLQ